MDWFYDVLRFCNDTYSFRNEDEYLRNHINDIINGEDVYSSNEIANEYILKKSCNLLDIINRGGSKEDILNYVNNIRNEWGDIVYCYNLVKFERGK